MSLVGFATDRGFGHWSRMENYITFPSLRDKALIKILEEDYTKLLSKVLPKVLGDMKE